MARKKKEKVFKSDMVLENEFTMYMWVHKYSVVQAVLFVKEDKGIYDHYLIRGKYDDLTEGLSEQPKAKAIAFSLYKKAVAGDSRELDELYNFCWEEIQGIIPDNQNFTQSLVNE